MKNIFKKINKFKYRNLICVLGLVLVFIVLPKQVFAGPIDRTLYVIGESFGYLVTFLIGFLMKVAAYNDFTTSTAVQTGWKLMRDVCNMFFIVFLMVIAVSTIIRVESYNYKKTLPTLLVKAVLINFSLMFCGILIDVSQVITLTFVDAFKGAGAGNFITGLGLSKIYQMSISGNPATGVTSTLFYGMIMLAIATVVIAALVFVFLGRIIAFWILIVLSPFTFLASATGGGGHGAFGKYADKWWDEFTKYLIVGPVLAFFLWLSLSVMRQASLGAITRNMSSGLPSVGFSEAGTPDNFVAFCISIAMLLGSLVAAQQIGAAGSGVAGKVLGGIKTVGMAPIGAAGWGVKKFGRWTGRTADDIVGRRLTQGAAGLGYWGAVGLEKMGLKGKRLSESKKSLKRVYDEGGAALRTWPAAWDAEFRRKEAELTIPSEGLLKDTFSSFMHGESVNAAFKAQMQLINEKEKTISDTSRESEFNRDQFFKAYDAGNFTEIAAALKGLFAENNHNDILVDGRWNDAKYADARVALIRTDKGEVADELVADPLHFSRLIKHIQDKTKVSDNMLGGITYALQEIAVGKGNLGFGGIADITKEGDFVARDLDKKEQFNKHVEYVRGKASNMPSRNLVSTLHPTAIASEISTPTGTRYKTQTNAQKEIIKLIASSKGDFGKMRPDTKLAFTGYRHLNQLEGQEWGGIYDHLDHNYRDLLGDKFFEDEFMVGMEKFIGEHTKKFVPGLAKKSKGAPAPGGAPPPPPPMADVNKKKYDATQEKIKEFQDKNLDFYVSDDYEKNKGQYYEKGTMERIERSKSRVEKAKAEGKLTDFKTGMDIIDVMSGITTAKMQGKKGGSVSLAINAQNEKLRGLMREWAAGVYLAGEDKEKAIKQLGAFYLDQLKAQNERLKGVRKLSNRQLQAEVDSLKSSLSQASSISLVNKNREGFDARSVLRHELMHGRIERADQRKLQKIWDSISRKKKDEINKRIRSEWVGGEKFKDEDVMKEYFAEGAANFGRKDTSGGIQLTDVGQAKALQQAGISMKGL
jgi:hypothetical protein